MSVNHDRIEQPETVPQNPSKRNWRRDLRVLCAVQFLTLTGFGLYGALMAFYYQELGTQGLDETARWTALVWTLSSIALMITSPIWGKLGDRFGRRNNLLRATIGALIVVVLMYVVQTPAQYTFARVLQSTVCGTVPAAIALAATMVPSREMTKGLGALQTTNFVASAIGPLLGGFIADHSSYRNVYPYSIALMLISIILIVVFLPEYPTSPVKKSTPPSDRKSRFRLRMPTGLGSTAIVMLGTMAGMTFADFIISPIFALYVQSLAPASANLGTLTGSLSAGTAIASSVAAILSGRLAERVGEKRLLVVCLVGVGVMLIPQALATQASQLYIWRILQGAFAGALLPTANSVLGLATSAESRGSIFGLATGAQAGARIPASSMSAWLAVAIGMPTLFIVAAVTYGLLGLLVTRGVKQGKKTQIEHSLQESEPAPAS